VASAVAPDGMGDGAATLRYHALMRRGTVLLTTTGQEPTELGYLLICSGYLVRDGRVLLVHHNTFDKWVPPGGHLEPDETFAQGAVRECFEETGLRVRVLSAAPVVHPPDGNSTPEPTPFYVDVEREGFDIPALAQFFFLQLEEGEDPARASAQTAELYGLGWYEAADLAELPTFPQVRSLAAYALQHHPDSGLSPVDSTVKADVGSGLLPGSSPTRLHDHD